MSCPGATVRRLPQGPAPARPWFPFRLSRDAGAWDLQWWRLSRGRFCYGEAASESLYWTLRVGLTGWWTVRSS